MNTNMISVETTGKTVEEAILMAVAQLGTRRDKLEIEVLSEPETALFGIIKKKEARIRATKKMDVAETAKVYLEELFDKMGVDARATVMVTEDTVNAELSGERLGVLIGKRGETLDAIRYLLSLHIGKLYENKYKIVVDTEGYLAKREESLQKLAISTAHKVKKTRRKIALRPMNSYERRIVHSALQDDPYVKTISEGEEPYRKVIVVLK